MEPAGWAWLAILIFVAIFEGWAILTNNSTLSEFIWDTSRTHLWFRLMAPTLFAYLAYHLFNHNL